MDRSGYVNIAIIDSGILHDMDYVNRLAINDEMRIINQSIDDSHSLHGSICASIIQKYTSHISLHSIKILDSNNTAPIDKIIAGLKWCIDNKMKVVNLSIGSVYYKDSVYLANIVDCCVTAGIIIISATSNNGWKTYPSSFDNVIGVKADISNDLLDGQYLQINDIYRNVDYCSFCPTAIKNGVRFFEFNKCNSYATPVITAHVYNILIRNPHFNLQDVKQTLNICSQNRNNYIQMGETNPEHNEIPIVSIVFDDYALIESSKLERFLQEIKCLFSYDDYNAYVFNTKNETEIKIANSSDNITPYFRKYDYIINDAWYSQSDIIIILGDNILLEKIFPELDTDISLYITNVFNDIYSINGISIKSSFNDLPKKIMEYLISEFQKEA